MNTARSGLSHTFLTWAGVGLILLAVGIDGAETPYRTPGDAVLADYFRAETAKITATCLAGVKSPADWPVQREALRRQLTEMLGLWPLPERTDLKPVITGKIEREDFTVEKLQFQSQPGLYVTANLYLPKPLEKPAPAILYLCGHSQVVSNGISYGNKVGYQHHGIWFARNGYVCLVIDTLQLGEIQGLHHGTYREGLWWWNSRGYTPAGVEAWNGIRSLDYLGSRPEVDTNRFGLTGRSGGGAYSWMVAALDDRVKVVAPVAGITDLQNHVVDGVVEGHCDCMYFVNMYRWDYPQLAALCAPRPLLLVNTDADDIFPLDGVMRTYDHLRRLYQLLGAGPKLGLVIGPGPHKDTQNLQVAVLRWFNQFLQKADPVIDKAAIPLFTPAQLRVFDQLPTDQINTRLHERFVARADIPEPTFSPERWRQQSAAWRQALKAKCFAGWPEDAGPPEATRVFAAKAQGIQYETYEFTSQPGVNLRLYLAKAVRPARPNRLVLRITEATNLVNADIPPGTVLACMAPRGFGLSAWSGDAKRQIHIRRRFMLLGQTVDGMRVWDICRGLEALRALKGYQRLPLWLEAEGDMAVNAVYAALFAGPVAQLNLEKVPASHQQGPDYLNVLQVLDIPQAVALVAENCRVRLRAEHPADWDYPSRVARSLQWPPDRFTVAPQTGP